METSVREFNAKKLGELMLYIADRLEDDDAFGATKLNKVLFFSDFIAYGRYGQPITGARYQKLDYGPAPKELMPIQKQLIDNDDAVVQRRERLGKMQKRLIALRHADLSLFTGAEIALVDEVIETLRGQSATQVSELSHRLLDAWHVADMQEEIPYQTVFVSKDAPTAADIARGQELARQHSWLAA